MRRKSFCIQVLSDVMYSSYMQWWWQRRYDQTGSHVLNNYPEVFGKFLLKEYCSAYGINPDDHKGEDTRFD